MTRIPLLAAALLGAAACMAQFPASAPSGGSAGARPSAPAAQAGDARRAHELVNARRRRVGCAPLTWDERAARAAQLHSEDMARRGYFSHTGRDGSQPWERMRAQGLAFGRAAENLAQTSAGAEDAVRLWIASPGHRENVDDCRLTHTGIGVSGDRWTQVFFTPLQPPAP